MSATDVIRDYLLAATGSAAAKTVAHYVEVIGDDVDPAALGAACRTASRTTRRQAASPAEILEALAPPRDYESLGEVTRRVLDELDERVRSLADGTSTDLAGRVRWLTVQARSGGLWGKAAAALLERERGALERARRQSEQRRREREQRAAWIARRDLDPPPNGEDTR